ncbi:MAG: winged helix-turn-helix transcriptional regulator [Clostridia bacterium]|nr:winged helix-turn-helix transcriptional regulator [Clostridia bacterium]
MMPPFMQQISITYRCAMRFREKELEDTGLAGCQTPYLTALCRQPGMTQEELAKELSVNKSSVTRQLAVLEEKGYVRREADPHDKRSLLVFPTEKTQEMMGRIFGCYGAWNEYLTQDFTQEEKDELSRMMVRIAQRAEAYVRGEQDMPDACGTED